MVAKYSPDNPAKFSDPILDVIGSWVQEVSPRRSLWLDPFAGVGKGVDYLRTLGFTAYGQEIEGEWAEQAASGCVFTGDSTIRSHFKKGMFYGVFTSPTYANRMRDHHNAKDLSKRHTYKHYLGRDLSPNNTGALGFNDEYRSLHRTVWLNCHYWLQPGGRLILNIKNHYKTVTRSVKGVKHKEEIEVHVAEWQRDCLRDCGFRLDRVDEVCTAGMRHGANGEKRTEVEYVSLWTKV